MTLLSKRPCEDVYEITLTANPVYHTCMRAIFAMFSSLQKTQDVLRERISVPSGIEGPLALVAMP